MSTNGTGPTIVLDGEKVAYNPGETVYEAATRHGKDIPTLCYDPQAGAVRRLPPVRGGGGGRTCTPVASCTAQCQAGMEVRTRSARVEVHRRTLMEMLASENREVDVDELTSLASQEMTELVDRYEARTGRFQGRKSGASRPDDPNPFIMRDYDNCISCYRCVRVCAEQEGDYAISVKGRGFDTQITVEFDGHLKESACTFCGQCVHTCPTGRARRPEGACPPRRPRRDEEDPHGLPLLRGRVFGGPPHPRQPADRGTTRHGRPRQPGRPVREGSVRLRLRAAPRPACAPVGARRGRRAAPGRLGRGA